MNFSIWNAPMLALVMALSAVSQSSFAGQQRAFGGQTAVADVTAPQFKVDRSVDDLATAYCPRGLERFLPGSYYYCVGVRDMAKGNNARSREMLRIAAGWGNKSAQFLLGMGYFKGDVEPLDRPLGLAWMGLASERRDPSYTEIFSSAWKRATPQEQARAQEFWRSMLPTYGDAHAAHRAELRFKHERDALVSEAAYGGRVCLAGLTSNQIASARPGNDDTLCSSAQPVSFVAKELDVYAEQLFDGWSGHVTVGPLKIASPSPTGVDH
jgi:hypothetical protein